MLSNPLGKLGCPGGSEPGGKVHLAVTIEVVLALLTGHRADELGRGLIDQDEKAVGKMDLIGKLVTVLDADESLVAGQDDIDSGGHSSRVQMPIVGVCSGVISAG